jgi:hypothetical protein
LKTARAVSPSSWVRIPRPPPNLHLRASGLLVSAFAAINSGSGCVPPGPRIDKCSGAYRGEDRWVAWDRQRVDACRTNLLGCRTRLGATTRATFGRPSGLRASCLWFVMLSRFSLLLNHDPVTRATWCSNTSARDSRDSASSWRKARRQRARFGDPCCSATTVEQRSPTRSMPSMTSTASWSRWRHDGELGAMPYTGTLFARVSFLTQPISPLCCRSSIGTRAETEISRSPRFGPLVISSTPSTRVSAYGCLSMVCSWSGTDSSSRTNDHGGMTCVVMRLELQKQSTNVRGGPPAFAHVVTQFVTHELQLTWILLGPRLGVTPDHG